MLTVFLPSDQLYLLKATPWTSWSASLPVRSSQLILACTRGLSWPSSPQQPPPPQQRSWLCIHAERYFPRCSWSTRHLFSLRLHGTLPDAWSFGPTPSRWRLEVLEWRSRIVPQLPCTPGPTRSFSAAPVRADLLQHLWRQRVDADFLLRGERS